MGDCFKAHLDFGWSNIPEWSNEVFSGLPMLYNAVFFLQVNTILIAIISGIIIDTFGEKRSVKDEIEKDIRDYCFICCQDREVFDLSGHGFRHHIKREHHIWNYVYLRRYLNTKPHTEYTGQEQYLQDHFERKDISFLPIKRAISLDQSKSTV